MAFNHMPMCLCVQYNILVYSSSFLQVEMNKWYKYPHSFVRTVLINVSLSFIVRYLLGKVWCLSIFTISVNSAWCRKCLTFFILFWRFYVCQIFFNISFTIACKWVRVSNLLIHVIMSKNPLCCWSRQTVKAVLFNNVKLVSIYCHRNIFSFVFVVWKLDSSKVASGCGWNVFIHKFGSVMALGFLSDSTMSSEWNVFIAIVKLF